jgi:glycosyltransferase involved in cell wall biosynthesis
MSFYESTDEAILVSVIVPVFNDWDLVPDLISKLEAQDYNNTCFELLLVDNGSESIPFHLKWPKWVRIVECRTPGSYAARNFGINLAKGKLLAFTDADCRPSPQWLYSGVQVFEKKYFQKLIVAGDVSIRPRDFKRMTRCEVFDAILGLPQKRYVSRGYAITANLFVPAFTFREVGFFDENRFSGGDAAFCRRAVSKGWELYFCKKANVVHPARREWNELATKQRRVKGAQILSGSILRRSIYTIATFFPPLRQIFYLFSSRGFTLRQRLSAFWILMKLWGVGVKEVFKICSGSKPERR